MKTIKHSSALLLVISGLAVGGCNRSDPSTVKETPKAAIAAVSQPVATAPTTLTVLQPAPTTSASVLSNAAAAMPTSTVGPSSAAATNRDKQTPILRMVRAGKQPGVDRLVFEFDSPGLPAWHVEYVDRPVRDCGSGDAVPVAGDAWLKIRFTGAQAHTEKGEATSGPRRRPLAQAIARELVRTCDFEGEVSWVLGVARPNPYVARAMTAPSRLVIDIAH